MSRPMEVGFMSNAGALHALEQLTVGRNYNRGTLEVIKTGKDNEVIGLKCSHHHLMSRNIDTMSQAKVKDLVDFMKDTVGKTLDEIGGKFKRADSSKNAAIAQKVSDLKNTFNRLIEVKKDATAGNGIGNLKALSRDEIKIVVQELQMLQKKTIDEFCALDTASLSELASYNLKQAKGLVHKFAEKGNSNKALRNDCILKKLEDEKYVKACGRRTDFDLLDFRTAPAAKTKNSTYTFEEVFSSQVGSVSKIGQELSKQGAKFCTLVRGDTTYNGGMLLGGSFLRGSPFKGYDSQEETVVRNLDPASTAYLFDKGILSMRKTDYGVQFEYARNPDNTRKLSPPDGFMMKGKFESVDNVKKNVTPYETDLLYAAMPPLNIAANATDIGGSVYYTAKCVELLSAKKVTEEERANAEKFFNDLLPQVREKFDANPEGVMIMKAAMFLSEEFNVFGSDEERTAGIKKLIDHFTNDRSGGALYERANANYEKVIGDRIDAWVQQAVARGDKVFLGSDIGCGVFGNDSAVVGRFFGAAFAKYGADMKFVYQEGEGDDYKVRRERFEAGFKEGFNAELSREVQIPESDMKVLGRKNGFDGSDTTSLKRALGDLRDEKKVFTYALNYVSRMADPLSTDFGPKSFVIKLKYLEYLKAAKEVIERRNDIAKDAEKTMHDRLMSELYRLSYSEDVDFCITSALTAAKEHLENLEKESTGAKPKGK